MAVLPDGRVVTGGHDGRVLIWDPAGPGTAPAELGYQGPGQVNAVAVLPDGRVVTGGDITGGCWCGTRPTRGRPGRAGPP